MFLVQLKLIEENCTPADKTDTSTAPSCGWANIKDALMGEWEIGGSARPAKQSMTGYRQIKKTSEGI
jgi:hypothetical protein